MDDIELHEPGSSHASLANGPGGFDRQILTGTWTVLWSTLPMWKDKHAVEITYTPEGGSHDVFESVVRYFKPSATKASTVRGTETLSPNTNGVTFDWRGKGWLFFVTSHWELLGYGKEDGAEWAVSYFSKTLFTPAGLDIYIRRQRSGNVDGLIERIAARLQTVPGVEALAKEGFRVQDQ